MLILMFLIFLLIAFFSKYMGNRIKNKNFSGKNRIFSNEFFESVNIISLFCTAIVFIFMVLSISCLSFTLTIDEKINILTEENKKIELSMDTLVSKYQKFEGETYKSFKDINPTLVFNMYPELKSNELVNQQIEVYIRNNDEIKKLKFKSLDRKIYKFALYFGD